MSDNEAMHTLRALNALRADIADIAGPPAPLNEPVDPFDSFTLTAAPEQLDSDENEAPTLEEVATAFKEAWESLKTARYAMFGYSTFQRKRRVSKNSATFPNTSKERWLKSVRFKNRKPPVPLKQQIPPNKIQPQGKRLI